MALNVTAKQEGHKLILTVDLSQTFGPSKSGKTTIIATTNGNAAAPNSPEVKYGLNVYKARG